VYVQHLMEERGAEVWRWLEQGAAVYVCGAEGAVRPSVRVPWEVGRPLSIAQRPPRAAASLERDLPCHLDSAPAIHMGIIKQKAPRPPSLAELWRG